ncbi:VOC family protein [Sulfitobacter mediterraneus]|uniref:Glyoxalase n=1 Tax=Sulfitobacter mediterraneus TaxID=83219 RepID=A0A061SV28_9RHOB|nr:VOC family protein [Sulfitobacter mediterraneus]KAJ03190.1 glyoxalase [Sulfitobacter mediterraneus]
MIDHSGIQVADIKAARAFYDACFAALGAAQLMEVPTEYTGGMTVVGYGRDKPDFWVSEGETQKPPLHFAFTAMDHGMVNAFYEAALAAGGTENGAPGTRPQYHENYYGAFVLDPEGNNIEAVCHAPQ